MNNHWEEIYRIFGIKIINVSDFTELVVRLLLNSLVLAIIVFKIYSKKGNNKDFDFSYLAVGTITFLLCFLLGSVKIELGFALGLFAVFGIIRYRTNAIPIKEMTYLFVIIGISVINALSNKKVSHIELLLTNAVVVFGLNWLEKFLLKNKTQSINIVYEDLRKLHADKQSDLFNDIAKRTGYTPVDVKVKRINYVKNLAELKVYYKDEL